MKEEELEMKKKKEKKAKAQKRWYLSRSCLQKEEACPPVGFQLVLAKGFSFNQVKGFVVSLALGHCGTEQTLMKEEKKEKKKKRKREKDEILCK